MVVEGLQLDQSLLYFWKILIDYFVLFYTRTLNKATYCRRWNTHTTFSLKKDPVTIEEVYIIKDSIMVSCKPHKGPSARTSRAPWFQMANTIHCKQYLTNCHSWNNHCIGSINTKYKLLRCIVTITTMYYLVTTKKVASTIALKQWGQPHPLLYSHFIFYRQ